jgi:hypothetical protein
MWFIVSEVFGDVVVLRYADVDDVIDCKINLVYYNGKWRRAARVHTTGRYFITKCFNGTFEFRGDNGPPFSQPSFYAKPYSATHIKFGLS